MNRKNFLRNAMMALAVSLVPKILQPCTGEIEDDLEVWYNVKNYPLTTAECFWPSKKEVSMYYFPLEATFKNT